MENEKVKLRIDKFYRTEEQQFVFLRRLALTFRARLPLLSELFQIDENELFEKLRLYNPDLESSLNYLYNCDVTDQEVARRNIISFYQRLLNAVLSKDKIMQKYLIGKISDVRIKELIKEKHFDRRLTDDEIRVILEYQLKYALDRYDVASMLNINPDSYCRRVNSFIRKFPEYQDSYDRLVNYNKYRFRCVTNGKKG